MHYCYILLNPNNRSTYNGYTVNLNRRLRQHNGELVGGAKSTSRYQGWQFLFILWSSHESWDKRKALSMEWHIRYPNGKRPRPPQYIGAQGRLQGVREVIALKKFEELKGTWNYWICDGYYINCEMNKWLELPESKVVEEEVLTSFETSSALG